MPAPLSIAPRPYRGEAITSWISRIAARYDLTAMEFVRYVLGHRVIRPGRLERIDYKADEELETALAAAASLSPARIRALRIVGDDGAAGCWHRLRRTWCRACLRGDIEQRGEIHERAAWRLGSSVICPEHRIMLEDTCSRCMEGAFCGFSHRDGMIQLVCRACRHPVALGPPCGDGAPPLGESAFGVVVTRSLIGLVQDLQHDIQGSLAGKQSRRFWGGSSSPPVLPGIIMHLTLCILWTTRMEGVLRIELPDPLSGQPLVPVHEPITPAILPLPVAFGVLAIAAAVLSSLEGARRPLHRWEPYGHLDASSFVLWLQPSVRDALKTSTAWWPAEAGSAMRTIIDATGEARSEWRG